MQLEDGFARNMGQEVPKMREFPSNCCGMAKKRGRDLLFFTALAGKHGFRLDKTDFGGAVSG